MFLRCAKGIVKINSIVYISLDCNIIATNFTLLVVLKYSLFLHY